MLSRGNRVTKAELSSASVVVAGVPHAADISPSDRKTRTRLTPTNVYWLRTAAGEWCACVCADGETQFKTLSLAACKSIWRNVGLEDIGSNEIIVRAGVTRPFVPQVYHEWLLRAGAATRPRKKVKCTAQFNVALRPSAATVRQSWMYAPTDFFARNEEATADAAAPADPALLLALLKEATRTTRTRGRRAFAALSALKTLDDLAAYPHRLLLEQFYCFCFRPV